MKQKTSHKVDIMKQIATFIVKRRFAIYLLFLAAAVYCIFSVGKVQVNSDITAFLPEETETRQGLTVMEEEFITYATASVMVSNITYERAGELADAIAGFEGVAEVGFDDTRSHYVNSAALFSISFDGEADDERVVAAMDEVRAYLDGYDVYISTQIGEDFSSDLAQQMLGVILLAGLVIVTVLLFTSRSYFEVVIFFIVFAVAALLNMGTNFWLGEISSITNSIAIILQLALAIDYAIIFSHRYQYEAAVRPSEREAVIAALSKAIIEISSSSLTTISGLVALTLMQFRLGYDLGVVLSKGILCSLITVFLLMPGLILLFPKQLKHTAHKSLVPNIRPWGNFLVKARYLFVGVFILTIPFAIYFSGQTEYAFADSTIDELVYSESREIMHKITDTFDDSTAVAVLVPTGDFEAEKAILNEVSGLEGVKSALGLANIEIEEGRVLTDSYTPRMFAELLDIDVEEATLLFQAYGAQHEEYQPIFGSAESYSVVLVDIFLYLFEKSDQGIVTLDSETQKTMDDLRETLNRGLDQLRGKNWDRLVLTATVPVEGEKSLALVDQIRAITEQYYDGEDILVIGDITSARDLADSFNGDSAKINLLTILFVFVILLFTFRSLVGSVLLVFVIQGSIWMNFAFTYLMGAHTSFVTYMIVSAIQMGATIDYAIVLMNRYQSLKAELPPKQAIAEAVNQSFATVFTSGSIMTVAGLLIASRVSDVYVGHIGLAVGRGALISVILVLTVLPQVIYLCDKAIDKTKFQIHLKLGGDE